MIIFEYQKKSNNNKEKSRGRRGNLTQQAKRPKAIAMLSGGLDSTLALAITKQLGVDVVALSLKTPFCNFDCGSGACAGDVSDVARKQNVKWVVRELGDEYIAMVRNPRYGRGSGMNPCIDCRIMMFKEGKKLMEEVGADFIVTGEVLGQRPMSQNLRAMEIIERESGLEGKILRPLSARLLKPTHAELEGKVDRNKLLAISGRSRKEQMRLARELGIDSYPNPAGGCILTEKAYSRRLKDLFDHSEQVSRKDVDLLKIGRHFRLFEDCKLIVGRNMVENNEIMLLAAGEDVLLEVKDYVGPTCMLSGKGNMNNKAWEIAASICVRYSDSPRNEPQVLKLFKNDGSVLAELKAMAAKQEDIIAYML